MNKEYIRTPPGGNSMAGESFSIVGVPRDERGTWMQVLGGRRFYPLDPRAEEVFIEDIAQSLSRQIRYNGLSDGIINVGQHSCNAAWLAEYLGYSVRVQLAALMHDSPETYVADMVRPLKIEFPEYRAAEERVMDVINDRFHLPIVDHKTIKYFDNLCLAWEKRDMYPSSEEWPMMLEVPDFCPVMETWTHEFTEIRFLGLFHWLMAEVAHG